MKTYQLDLQNIGEDTYCIMSKGHHDFSVFMAKVIEEYPSWPLGRPEHTWYKAVPWMNESGLIGTYYHPSAQTVRGSFPVTVCIESYGADRWPTQESTPTQPSIHL